MSAAVEKTWDVSILSLRMFGRMLTGDVSMRNLSGPLRIGQYAGESARVGMETFVGFMALVSISLGILNLLPIPLLDGGQIVFQFAELVKGRPVSERVELISQQIGILLLVMIMGIAFYNDIVELVG